MQAAFIPALRISQRLSKPFWPPALASQAPPAIILAVLHRFRGPALFRGLRLSSRQGVPFWPSGLTLRSSGPAFCGPLTLAVSPFIFRFMQAYIHSSASPLSKVSPLGFLALCRASPAFAWSVSGLLGLWRLCSKRNQLSFLQRCAASVAQRFFVGCALLQGWALPFGFRV